MAKTLISKNIPQKSNINDIAPDTAWLSGYSVESLDAFIKASAGDVSYGLEAGKMYTWLFKKANPRNAYTTEEGKQIPARFVLKWQEVKTGFEATSNVYLTEDDLKDWLEKVYNRTNGRVNEGLPPRTNLHLLHALDWLSKNPISLAWDYINDSNKPYISFKWISNGDKEEHGRNAI